MNEEQQREDVVIPVVEEEVTADAVPVKTGSVRVDKHVEKRIRTVDTPLLHEEVDVRRVPVNRVVNEMPAVRKQRNKPETGKVALKIRREGSEVIVDVGDDGGGLDRAAIRRKAYEKGLIAENQKLTDEQAVEMILRPGFSTASELTQAAGRGVGMDVVDNEVKKLGGSMRIESTVGQGTRFLIRLPYTLAITHALIVNVGDETFALPLPIEIDSLTAMVLIECVSA